jgi:hypothetical protein
MTKSINIDLSIRQIQFNIYEVFPLSESPAFRLVSSFRCEGCRPGYAFRFLTDYFLFQDEEKVLVWNHVEDTYALWRNQCNSTSVRCS